ncbi:BMP family ABC transporter substrate-binding protein [Geodermatophilus sabuli]|uniref:Nucleoside-binding protein n=1 Tax=Geodermatophilus sabuli TaxID=1564158 RepID=A0A285EI05_9ACTN|nr:BMP family ABC transporter substrate-binding protein [Geodermatophilus sabuli]MBB3086524.1 basic membrane protein A [Geodermatophilus sabuli]SNX97824.1 nucleoside-binding protein [Geodermatophilus sabuli]
MRSARVLLRSTALCSALLLTATACGGDSGGGGGGGGGAADGEAPRVAAVFSGTTTDADYTFLGLQALEAAEAEYGAETTYSESVAVPDAQRVLREYVADGYTVIWTHGSQFYDATVAVAEEAPDVVFIAEQDTEPADVPDNVWVLDRNFHLAFYPLGVLAAATTQSQQIAYLGGATLPFSYSEVHAVEQALEDVGSTATLTPVWTGDLNDPTRGQQFTSQLIAGGADVVLGSLNLGMVGAFEAVKAEPAGAVRITAKYTDKSDLAPDHYLTSVLYDFSVMLDDILGQVQGGETGGYLGMTFEQGISLQPPVGVDQAVVDQVDEVIAGLSSGEIEVERDVTPVE